MSVQDPRRAAAPGLRVRLAPELPSLASLGVSSWEVLLADDVLVPHARRESLDGAHERLRFPLPGTPLGPNGARTSAPAGAGTGWVVLDRWRGSSLRELLPLRFTAPRSSSLAERHWNLLCHLRAHGVGTPEPWAVGARGDALVARDSFLVTRAFEEGTLRLDRVVAGDAEHTPSEAALDHAGDALASTLRALAGAGVLLPQLDARGVWLRFPRHALDPEAGGEGAPGCGLAQLADWRAERALGGLGRDPRPAVLVADVRGARLQGGNPAARLAALRRALVRPPVAPADPAEADRWTRLGARVAAAVARAG